MIRIKPKWRFQTTRKRAKKYREKEWRDMKHSNITITYDGAKVMTLKWYLLHKEMTLEEELPNG